MKISKKLTIASSKMKLIMKQQLRRSTHLLLRSENIVPDPKVNQVSRGEKFFSKECRTRFHIPRRKIRSKNSEMVWIFIFQMFKIFVETSVVETVRQLNNLRHSFFPSATSLKTGSTLSLLWGLFEIRKTVIF